MNSLYLDELFNPPQLEILDRVHKKEGGILARKRGTVVSTGGWFAVVRWDGSSNSRREYIPDLALDVA
jgi:hypothetical protein